MPCKTFDVPKCVHRRHPPGGTIRRMFAMTKRLSWAHAKWVRIHSFANGNGRTACAWANLILMRYGLPPVVALRPRPGGGYAAVGAAAMRGRWQPTVNVFRRMLKDHFARPGTALAARKKPKPHS